jgi:hypothetical protein
MNRPSEAIDRVFGSDRALSTYGARSASTIKFPTAYPPAYSDGCIRTDEATIRST